jgi:archaellum component FlaG (FlaF/FlaG flagellin family)
MKKNVFFITSLFISASLLWQCSKKTDDGSLDLKTSLNSTSTKINDAVNKISSTSGYSIITLQDESAVQTASVQNALYYDSIDLADIKGIYEYKPVSYKFWHFYNYDRLFQKTGESNFLIVKMPKEKIFPPHRFHNVILADTSLKNNFVITATDYHNYFKGNHYDYKLSAGFVLDTSRIGNLDILSTSNKSSGCLYSAKFTFENGYGIDVNSTSGDTAVSSFALSDSKVILLKESILRIKTDGKKHREKEYTLTIGNIDIKRTAIKDSFQIFEGGVLQTNAKVEFIDNDSIEGHSICSRRDIQITFDDGTKTKVSELIGPSLTILSTLVDSMQSIYFSSKVIDYIAWSITNNKGYKKEGVK